MRGSVSTYSYLLCMLNKIFNGFKNMTPDLKKFVQFTLTAISAEDNHDFGIYPSFRS